MDKYVMRNLELYFPFIAHDAVDICEDGFDCVVVTLKNGDKVRYDDYFKTIRTLPKNSHDLTESQFRREFSTKLYKLLTHRHMTQGELSDKSGISQITISNYITGKSTPSFYHIDKIAKALGCAIDDLRYS